MEVKPLCALGAVVRIKWVDGCYEDRVWHKAGLGVLDVAWLWPLVWVVLDFVCQCTPVLQKAEVSDSLWLEVGGLSSLVLGGWGRIGRTVAQGE